MLATQAAPVEARPLDARVTDVDQENVHAKILTHSHRHIAGNKLLQSLERLHEQRAVQIDSSRYALRNGLRASPHIDHPPAQCVSVAPFFNEGLEPRALEIQQATNARIHDSAGDGVARRLRQSGRHEIRRRDPGRRDLRQQRSAQGQH